MIRLAWFAIAACAALAACDKKSTSGLPPAESWKAPDPSGGMTGPAAANPHGGGGDPHAGVPGAPPLGGGGGADPHAGVPGAPPLGGTGGGGGVDVAQLGLPPPDPNKPVDPSKFLEGTIALGPAHASRVPAGSAIFLAVRKVDPASGQGAGAPIAVEKLVATGTWPLAFKLTEAQAMIGGTGFSGDVVVAARFDQDSDAMSKQPGDITGQVRATIPAKGLTITLDTVLP